MMNDGELHKIILLNLAQMLHKCSNPYIKLYYTAKQVLDMAPEGPFQIWISLHIKLIVEEEANMHCANLPTVSKVAAVIPNEYNEPFFHNITLFQCN